MDAQNDEFGDDPSLRASARGSQGVPLGVRDPLGRRMPMSNWGLTPRASIEAECRRRGTSAVAAACTSILLDGAVDDDLLWVVAGPATTAVLAGREGGRDGYWPRVWATRGLLHAWDDAAAPALTAAIRDDAWRVREMAAKVVAKHHVEDAFEEIVRLRDDPVARVRAAAERSLARLTREGA